MLLHPGNATYRKDPGKLLAVKDGQSEVCIGYAYTMSWQR